MTSIESNRPRVFLDTNVIIDALALRDYDYLPSRQIWRHVLYKEIDGFICSKQITDLYYIFKKLKNMDLKNEINPPKIAKSQKWVIFDIFGYITIY